MELIKISINSEGQTVVSARDLYAFLEATERFSNWCERMFTYDFVENRDYVGCKVFNTLARQELQDYALTLNCAKEICMIQRNERGKQARQYFIDCETKLKAVQASASFLPEELMTTIREMIENAKREFVTKNEMDTIVKGMDKGIENFYTWMQEEHFETIEKRLQALEQKGVPAQFVAVAEVYLIQEGITTKYKIGASTEAETRNYVLNIGNSQILHIAKSIPFPTLEQALSFEKYLHEVFKHKKVRGEWFELDEQDLRFIDRLAYVHKLRMYMPDLEDIF
jgi:phage anti-repressor protein